MTVLNGMHSSHGVNGINGTNGANGDATTSATLHICIAGAGLGGLSAAIALALQNHKVVIFEAANQISEVGAGVQCSPNVTRLFEKWGLAETLAPLAVEPRQINLRRWSNGNYIGKTRLTPDFRRDFGAPYWVVHRAHLLDALLKRAESLGVEVKLKSKIVNMTCDETGSTVQLENGMQYSADIVVGADGIKSVTRKVFLKDEDAGPQHTRFCAYRATVPADVMRADPELSALIETPDINLWVGHDRHVMTYLIAGGKTFNMVLSHPAGDQAIESKLTPDEILEDMRNNYAGWDPILVKVVRLIGNTMRWPLFEYPAISCWVNKDRNFALMGDACHGMLPYMSSGAGMAIEDAAALGIVLSRQESFDTVDERRRFVGDRLELYQQARWARATEVQDRSTLNGRIWHYPDGPDQEARDAGMAASLGNEHYIRCTNQWSDPSTQVWLYGHDAEAEALRIVTKANKLRTDSKLKFPKGVVDMRLAGLLGP